EAGRGIRRGFFLRDAGPALPLEGIFNRRWRSLDQAAEVWLHFFDALLHFPGDFAITEMALDATADAGDVFGLGEIHFKEKPRFGPERQQIFARRRREG